MQSSSCLYHYFFTHLLLLFFNPFFTTNLSFCLITPFLSPRYHTCSLLSSSIINLPHSSLLPSIPHSGFTRGVIDQSLVMATTSLHTNQHVDFFSFLSPFSYNLWGYFAGVIFFNGIVHFFVDPFDIPGRTKRRTQLYASFHFINFDRNIHALPYCNILTHHLITVLSTHRCNTHPPPPSPTSIVYPVVRHDQTHTILSNVLFVVRNHDKCRKFSIEHGQVI